MSASSPSVVSARPLRVSVRQAAVVGGVVVLVALAVLAWSDSRSTARSVGATAPVAVSGTAIFSGGVAPGSPHPYGRARLSFTGVTASGARLLRYFQADRRGRFSIRLPAGTYTARVAGQPAKRVTIRAGHPVRLRLWFNAK
jgi:hypothetical protein